MKKSGMYGAACVLLLTACGGGAPMTDAVSDGTPEDDFVPGVPSRLRVVSNLPRAQIEQPADPEGSGVRVTSLGFFSDSLRYYSRESDGEPGTSIYIGVKNFGSRLQCGVWVVPTVLDAAGRVLVTPDAGTGLVWGRMFDVAKESFGETRHVALGCLEPGGEGVALAGNFRAEAVIAASQVARITFELQSESPREAVRLPEPALDSIEAVDRTQPPDRDFTTFEVMMHNGDRAIERLVTRFYVRDRAGYFRDHAAQFRDDPLPPRASLEFEAHAPLSRSYARDVAAVFVSYLSSLPDET